ncbi:hypothetical protein B0A55_02784 [Friedmanniomyces simplex]|uniref:Uncharacterized protein n=1 Tax=Friedmanniomyces simplex TaxID=329884 RepID=A0A4U0XQK2_9PEZI|nr:hypothetical protein B0A55_02784 [Friedmanniomyces simplex]
MERRSSSKRRSAEPPKLDTDLPPEERDAPLDLIPTVRELNMAEYCNAYSDLSLATLGIAFPKGHDTHKELSDDLSLTATPSGDEMEGEVSVLIARELLPHHRLDVAAEDGRVVSVEQGAWEGILGKAMEAAGDIEHEMLLRLHQVNVVLAGLEVKGAFGWAW